MPMNGCAVVLHPVPNCDLETVAFTVLDTSLHVEILFSPQLPIRVGPGILPSTKRQTLCWAPSGLQVVFVISKVRLTTRPVSGHCSYIFVVLSNLPSQQPRSLGPCVQACFLIRAGAKDESTRSARRGEALASIESPKRDAPNSRNLMVKEGL